MYTFTYQRVEFIDGRIDVDGKQIAALGDIDCIHCPVDVTVRLSEDDGSSLGCVVAALRQILVASGFTDRQARQVVVLPYGAVKE
jgi:hypothetical protein